MGTRMAVQAKGQGGGDTRTRQSRLCRIDPHRTSCSLKTRELAAGYSTQDQPEQAKPTNLIIILTVCGSKLV